ncbi:MULTISPECIES: carbonic anhydrase family protein [Bacillaceae]|uniref:carbonic anhydrase n=1 Tax=Domibacillus aminovorans TaxID=29332 RepID=A0A177KT20_9BACI|nr:MULTISPECIES: carbonic anhydrase family protein [Bacillaceae]OAH55731.1 hypothetical protein AWH48_03380 [Domibacillus aminovorans]
MSYTPSDFSLVNNGHTVQANAAKTDNVIVVEGKEYTLVQYHFHTPSEHQFIDMSKEQIDAFRQIFLDNHRPIQALEGREVIEK